MTRKTIKLDSIPDMLAIVDKADEIDDGNTYHYAMSKFQGTNMPVDSIFVEIEEDDRFDYIQHIRIWTHDRVYDLKNNGHVHYFDQIERHPPEDDLEC